MIKERKQSKMQAALRLQASEKDETSTAGCDVSKMLSLQSSLIKRVKNKYKFSTSIYQLK